jgi:hypothetical protein
MAYKAVGYVNLLAFLMQAIIEQQRETDARRKKQA